MKSTKKRSKAKAAGKTARAVTKAKKPAASKAKPARAAKAAAASKSTRTAAQATKAAPPAKPVHEWAEAIKKAALQNKQGHNTWPGAGSPSWKGKQRPE